MRRLWREQKCHTGLADIDAVSVKAEGIAVAR